MSNVVNTSFEYLVSTPDDDPGVLWLEYDSWTAGGGCEGVAIRAVATKDRTIVPIMVKQFYKDTYDDAGEPFTQDPDKKAEESYAAFQYLSARGFNVPPFFALGVSPEGNKVLLMTDLSKVGELEVYDEKLVHRNTPVKYSLNGEETSGRMGKMLGSLANQGDVNIAMLRTSLLKSAYNVCLGSGVQHIIVRNPINNTAEVFVVDVGEFSQYTSQYAEAADAEKLVAVPHEEIVTTYQQLLDSRRPGLDAAELYAMAREAEPLRRQLQDVWYQAAVGLGLRDYIGGMTQDAEWAKRKFVRNGFDEHFLKIKLHLHNTSRVFAENYGSPLNQVDESSVQRFLNAETTEDLLVGLDLAFQAVTDSHVQHTVAVREAVDANRPVPEYTSSVSFSDANLPHLEFFDNYDESNGDTCRVSVYGQSRDNLENYQLELELDWDAGYRAETHGGRAGSVVLPEQIKRVRVVKWQHLGEVVVSETDFDPSELNIIPTYGRVEPGATLSYLYCGELVYVYKIQDSDDLRDIRRIIEKTTV